MKKAIIAISFLLCVSVIVGGLLITVPWSEYIRSKPKYESLDTAGDTGSENSSSVPADALNLGVYTDYVVERYSSQQYNTWLSVKDLDADGIDELLVKQYPTVYVFTYDNGVQEAGVIDAASGTVHFLECETYPGIVKFSVGGGLEHYNYITVKDGQVVTEEIWKYNFSKLEGYPETIEISTDKKLTEESKTAYASNRELEFTKLSDLLAA